MQSRGLLMSGGGSSSSAGGDVFTSLMIFGILIALLLIRTWIVQISYNNIMPKLAPTGYNQLTFTEALWMTLLVTCLVGN